MKTNDNFGFMNMPAFEELRKLQEQFNNSALVASMKEMQRAFDAISIPTTGITAAVQAYRDSIAPLEETWHKINDLYAPILEQSKTLEQLYNSSMIAVLHESTSLTKMLAQLDFSSIQGFADSFRQCDLQLDNFWSSIDVNTVAELYNNGTISNEDVAEELKEIVRKKDFSIGDSWDNIKKSKWFLAIRIIFILFTFLANPVIDKAKENALEALGVNEFWEESGIYEWLDNIFSIEADGAITEQEAKETVDRSNIGNVSKKKRDDLVSKISEIRNFIAAAPQDANTGNLLSYLSELEKDVNGKKYGLVFEEHREEIDEILDTHTPVLTENTDLYIDHGGQMNFLIEGDNLASLKLLEKTHRGKIDLIYIGPPYNTGNKDFIYDDAYVDKTDSFIHSKWLSFMSERLKYARKLLAPHGALIISIGYQEVHNLDLLCQEIFFDKQNVIVTVQTSGGKPNGGFNYTQEYLLFVVPTTFSPNAMSFTGGIERSPFEGLTLSTFDKTTRPNQTYPIFIEKNTMRIAGIGKSLTERIADGSYIGEAKDFDFNFDEAPEGTVAVWPISSKGADCVWRLISSRLLHDWELGYIKVSKNKSKACPNEYSLQYLPDGVIQKIEAGDLEVIGREENVPTLKLGKNETVGSEIPTIWTEKDFYTTKGSSYVRDLFGDKRFPYPKPLEFIVELLRASTSDDSLIVDFFAGSGTTGEAAMLLNKQVSGNRRFILCTNNENSICRDVTYERIKRIIEKEGYEASLKYYNGPRNSDQ